MKRHESIRVLATLTVAIASLWACRSSTEAPIPLSIPPIAFKEPDPPPPPDDPLAEPAATVNDQCPSAGTLSQEPGEPEVLLRTAGARYRVVIDPDYPAVSRDRCVSGWVAFQFAVSPEGRVENPRVISSHPSDLFQSAGLDALRRSSWVPKNRNDEPEGGCALFLFHHPRHPLDPVAVKADFPIDCPYPSQASLPFPRGPVEVSPVWPPRHP
jgi:TonB family protein